MANRKSIYYTIAPLIIVIAISGCGHNPPVENSEEVVKLCPPIPSYYLNQQEPPSVVMLPQATEADLINANESYDAWARQGWRRVRDIAAIQQGCTGGNE